jgi:UDP-N-acetylglucosamine--N-acetylmuramyl-(pentapeptide) pyrophosphoryl-undecaprenol N-acetylglucosamine transferase
MDMRILFTAGGTGGHIYPAVAIARAVLTKAPHAQILFITGIKEIERKIIQDTGFDMKTISVKGLPRKMSPLLIGFVVKLGVSVFQSMRIIHAFKPSLVMATGGYVSGPPVVAAWTMGIPVFMLEQNSYPGITTKKLARFSTMVFLGFGEASRFLKKDIATIVTGNPVRRTIGKKPREEASSVYGFKPDRKTILVFGGSQGSRAINSTLSEIIEGIADQDIQVLWQTGTNEFEKWRGFNGCSGGRIRVIPYIDDMSSAYSASDLVVSRAGAMTIAEITACGLPALFIPLPTAAENHQEYNARSLVEFGAAAMVLERDLTPEKLKDTVIGIIGSDATLGSMSDKSKKLGKTDAADIIAETLIHYLGKN